MTGSKRREVGIRSLLLLAGVLLLRPVSADDANSAEVIVLATLHEMHEQVDGYDYQDLAALIEVLDPDVLAVELTAEDVDSRRDQLVKREYQEAVFPLVDKHAYAVVPIEPPQPLYDELVGLIRKGHGESAAISPKLGDAFGGYADDLYAMLREQWTSACAVNSRTTDRLFESKHRFQGALFGPLEAEGWERWNRYFLEQIVETTQSNPGKRILVLVGAEHAYWLREQLASQDLVLLDIEAIMGCVPECARCTLESSAASG